MPLALTNLAWNPQDDAEVARLLHRHGVAAIDIAPTKYFADPLRAMPAEVRRVRQWWPIRALPSAACSRCSMARRG